MAGREETRAKIEALKRDQESLKSQLAELDTFMEKKAVKRTPPTQPLPQPRREYGRSPSPPQYEAAQRYAPPQYDETRDLLRQNVENSKELMSKFDYLLDTLIATMEETEGENIEDVIKTLASTQLHIIDILDVIRTTLDETRDISATKEKMVELEQETSKHYNELNRKMNVLMEKVEKPPYLQELDAIRVNVTNLSSIIRQMTGRGINIETPEEGAELTGDLKKLSNQIASMEDRIASLATNLEGVGTHVYTIEATTTALAGLKKDLDRMQEVISGKQDALLTETGTRSQAIEERIATLDESLRGLTELESRLGTVSAKLRDADKWFEKMPTEQLAELKDIQEKMIELKKGIPETGVKELTAKVDGLAESMRELSSHIREGGTISEEQKEAFKKSMEGLLEQVKSAQDPKLKKAVEELSRKVDEVSSRVTGEEVASAYAIEAIRNSVESISKELQKVRESSGKAQLDTVRNELKQMTEKVGQGTPVAEDVKRLSAELKELRGMMEPYGQKVQELASRLEQSVTKVGREGLASKEDVEALSMAADHLKDEVGYARAEMEKKLAEQALEIRRNMDDIMLKQEALEERISGKETLEAMMRIKREKETERALAEQEKTDQMLKQSVEALGKKIGELEQSKESESKKRSDEDERIQQAVQDINSKLSALEEEAKPYGKEIQEAVQKMKQLAERVQRNEGVTKDSVEGLRAGYEQLMKSTEEVKIHAASIDELRRKAKSVENSVNEAYKQIQEVQDKEKKELNEIQAGIGKVLTSLQTKLLGLEERVGEVKVDDELNDFEKRLSGISKNLEGVRSEFQQLRIESEKGMSGVNERLASTAKRFDKVMEEIGELDKKASKLTQDLLQERDEEKKLREQITELQNSLKKLGESKIGKEDYEAAATHLRQGISALEKRLDEVHGKESANAKRIDALKDRLGESSQALSELEEKTRAEILSRIRDEHEEVLKHVEDLQRKLREGPVNGIVLKAFTDSVRSDVRRTRELLTDERGPLKQLKALLDSVQKTADELEFGEGGPEKLEELKEGLESVKENIEQREKELGRPAFQEALKESMRKAEFVEKTMPRKESVSGMESFRKELFKLERVLSTGKSDYRAMSEKVRDLKERAKSLAEEMKHDRPVIKQFAKLREELVSINEDLLDMHDKDKGLAEAVSRLKEFNRRADELRLLVESGHMNEKRFREELQRGFKDIEHAKELVEHEREIFADTRLDLVRLAKALEDAEAVNVDAVKRGLRRAAEGHEEGLEEAKAAMSKKPVPEIKEAAKDINDAARTIASRRGRLEQRISEEVTASQDVEGVFKGFTQTLREMEIARKSLKDVSVSAGKPRVVPKKEAEEMAITAEEVKQAIKHEGPARSTALQEVAEELAQAQQGAENLKVVDMDATKAVAAKATEARDKAVKVREELRLAKHVMKEPEARKTLESAEVKASLAEEKLERTGKRLEEVKPSQEGLGEMKARINTAKRKAETIPIREEYLLMEFLESLKPGQEARASEISALTGLNKEFVEQTLPRLAGPLRVEGQGFLGIGRKELTVKRT
ncbi:MAG: hypothetical protein JW834_01760 [Candidatus Diapherotrites archaeon]|nr:hypothetical protein [Candidatus Diapherotrites archaeon]